MKKTRPRLLYFLAFFLSSLPPFAAGFAFLSSFPPWQDKMNRNVGDVQKSKSRAGIHDAV